MEQKEQRTGLKNMAINIKPILNKMAAMSATHKPIRLTAEENNSIVQFYLEVTNYIWKD